MYITKFLGVRADEKLAAPDIITTAQGCEFRFEAQRRAALPSARLRGQTRHLSKYVSAGISGIVLIKKGLRLTPYGCRTSNLGRMVVPKVIYSNEPESRAELGT
jgi:hypothetical protein